MNQNLIRFPTWRRTTLRRMNAVNALTEWSKKEVIHRICREIDIDKSSDVASLSVYRCRMSGDFLDFDAVIDS